MVKKVISFLLLITILIIICACNNNSESLTVDSNETSALNVTKSVNIYGDNLPDGLDFDNYEFTILTYKGGNIASSTADHPNYFDCDEEDGTTMNDSAYKRNMLVEERLNVKISCIEVNDNSVANRVLTDVMSGDCNYDLANIYSTERCEALLTQNVLFDLNDMSYIDSSADYYLQQGMDLYEINGAKYLLIGDLTYSSYSMVYHVFNKNLTEDYGLNSEDMYKTTLDGNLTIDVYMNWLKNTYADLNGNGKPDYDDQFGVTANTISGVYMFHCFGGRSVIKNDNGEYEFIISNESNVSKLERILELFENESGYFISSGNFPFFEGRSLFYFHLSTLNRLREIEDFDFGLLPMPKYDENQQTYESYICAGIACVPVIIENPERTGAIIEALYSASHNYTVDAFLNTYTEQKIFRDEKSIEIYRMLINQSAYELTRYFDPSNYLYNHKIINDLISKNSSNITSSWESIETAVRTAWGENYN